VNYPQYAKKIALLVLFLTPIYTHAAEVTGELKKWHKVTITFDGPETAETATPNPFLDYRMNVTFTHKQTGKAYLVPGYYAADGNASETSADSGNKWRVHFAPDKTGDWRYTVSFRKGDNVAVGIEPAVGQSAGYFDQYNNVLHISASDKKAPDFRAKGRLEYVREHYLQFAETKDFFIKQGVDAPENLLAYADFDGDFKTDGQKDELIKTWQAHIKDWKAGDPVFQKSKGKGLIGALNYLHAEGLNAFSFLTMNIEGDDRNVFPYTAYDERTRFDVSRLEQWEIIFEHADHLGLFLHFKTQETENDHLLDGGELGNERKLYYRELIARFSHHLALNWNLGEENTNTTAQVRQFCEYFKNNDPYQHHIVLHTYPNEMEKVYAPLLGNRSELTGLSLQTSQPNFQNVHNHVKIWVQKSAKAGKPWPVACDEPGDATHSLVPDKDNPAHDNVRINALWGALMAGGWGCEWYFGYEHDHSDLTCQDWRSRDKFWDQCRYAMEFLKKQNIPFWRMHCDDSLTNEDNDYCFFEEGSCYLIYQKQGHSVELSLPAGRYESGWFNPRTGDGVEKLIATADLAIENDMKTTLVAPDKNDWLLVIRRKKP